MLKHSGKSSECAIALAKAMFETLASETADPPGVTRAAYGGGENFAHGLARRTAIDLGCEVHADAIGNLYMTYPGRDRDVPGIWMGSHMDSVPHGGNYDGAAGVIAGLALISALKESGDRPSVDLTVMAIRAEEAAWFPLSYAGSHAALGLLPTDALRATRSDTGRTLADHMREAGFDPGVVLRAEPQIDLGRVGCFLEVHIEQGPRLVGQGESISLVSGIAGGFRFMNARCLGSYGHSGAAPRNFRQDAVLGFADFMAALEGLWDDLDRDGLEATITVGRLESDPSQHGGSKVLGEIGFTLDVRSIHKEALDRIETALAPICLTIQQNRGVGIELGESFTWPITPMDEALLDRLRQAGSTIGMNLPTMPSGAGHDAAVFAGAGVPTAMIFIRNDHGSHNPDETMDMADFEASVVLLLEFVRS